MSYSLKGRNLRDGCKGEDVEELQTALYNLGYNLGATGEKSDGVDSIFGPKTQLAVKAFQAEHHDPEGKPLNVDGTVGPKTAWALNATLEGLSDFLEDGMLTSFYVSADTLLTDGLPLQIRGPGPCEYKIYLCGPKICT